jgi:hypothetical protein
VGDDRNVRVLLGVLQGLAGVLFGVVGAPGAARHDHDEIGVEAGIAIRGGSPLALHDSAQLSDGRGRFPHRLGLCPFGREEGEGELLFPDGPTVTQELEDRRPLYVGVPLEMGSEIREHAVYTVRDGRQAVHLFIEVLARPEALDANTVVMHIVHPGFPVPLVLLVIHCIAVIVSAKLPIDEGVPGFAVQAEELGAQVGHF